MASVLKKTPRNLVKKQVKAPAKIAGWRIKTYQKTIKALRTELYRLKERHSKDKTKLNLKIEELRSFDDVLPWIPPLRGLIQNAKEEDTFALIMTDQENL